MLLSRAVRASWSIAAVLLVATPGRIARADNTATNEGAFQHLRALQDIASASGGNRAAGTSGYDRSAEYVAERLKEAGYVVRLEEFEFLSSRSARLQCLSQTVLAGRRPQHLWEQFALF